MYHHVFSPPKAAPAYRVAVLARVSAFRKDQLEQHYVAPLMALGVPREEILAVSLDIPGKAKNIPDAFAKNYLEQLLPELQAAGVTHLYVADAAYFKVLTKLPKVDGQYGYVLPVAWRTLGGTGPDLSGSMKAVLGVNYAQLIYNPGLGEKLTLGLRALAGDYTGQPLRLGADIIHAVHYPQTTLEVVEALAQLMEFPALTLDIEAFSLKFWEAGIGTFALCPDQHRGVGFRCDYEPLPQPVEDENGVKFYGRYTPNHEVRNALRNFLETYEGEIIFHGAAYDVKVLIYVLFMKDLLDQEGLLHGLDVLTREGKWHCTKIVGYLALNSTARQELGLKALAHEFAGKWAQDEIEDIRRIPLPDLLQYNVVDGLATWYVKNKYYPRMVADNQEQLYFDLMMPSQRLLVQTELTGMPMSAKRIQEIKAELLQIQESTRATVMAHPMIPVIMEWKAKRESEKNYLERYEKALEKNKPKIKPNPWQKYLEEFNPNSGPQVQALLYDFLELPVIDLTKTKQPATGADTIKKLLDHPTGQANKDLLQGLLDYAGVTKILSTYIPAFEAAIAKADDGIVWLHGSFVIGTVVSGRLSSKKPNLQNIPANSAYGKLVKTCFMAPPGWVFGGADFNSLEDMISALQTKDPAKLAVYEHGYDGHSLRAYYYFKDQLPEIRQAEPTERCFVIEMGNQTVMCKSGDLVILPDDTRMPVEDFYETHSGV